MTEQPNPTGVQVEILIVEDSPVEAEMLRRILVRAGYRVLPIAKNGEEGLQALREHPCTLVMSDINMPVMNGYELCHAIKFDEKLWSTPVVLVTALSEPKDIIKALDVGADGYITKPYVEDVLMGRIRSMLANPATRKLADERRRIQLEYGGEQHSVAVGSPQMANLLLSVYENSLVLNQEMMHIQNQLNVLNESLEEKIKERTAALRENEEKLRAIFESVLDGILLADAETRRFASGNPAICQMLGYSSEEIMQLGVADIHPEQALPNVIEQFEKQLRGEIQLAADIPVKRKDGSVFYADINSSPVSFGGKNYLLGIFRDITERKKMEEALRKSNERFDLAVKGTNDGIWDWDIGTNANYFSPRFMELLGYGPDEVAHELATFESFLHPEDRAWVFDRVRQHLEDKVPYNVEYRMRTKNGEYKWFQARGQAVRDPSGKPVRMAGSITDISERKQAETRLREQLNELNRWQEAMLGREMRTLELKREINELLKQAGQPPRYLSV